MTTLQEFIEKKEQEFEQQFFYLEALQDNGVVFESEKKEHAKSFLRTALRECATIAAERGLQSVTRFGVTEEGRKWLGDWLSTNPQPK